MVNPFRPVTQLLTWLVLHVRLAFYRWARREMCPSHPDAPLVFWKLQHLRDGIKKNPLRISGRTYQ